MSAQGNQRTAKSATPLHDLSHHILHTVTVDVEEPRRRIQARINFSGPHVVQTVRTNRVWFKCAGIGAEDVLFHAASAASEKIKCVASCKHGKCMKGAKEEHLVMSLSRNRFAPESIACSLSETRGFET
jgi:hypothetical protein